MCWLSTHLKWRFYIRVTWTDVITGKKSCSPLCCIAHKKQSEKPISWTNPRQEAPLPPFFLRTTFRISVITPASPLIEKYTNLGSSLWCAKRVFVSSRDRDFVAEVGKCGSRLLGLFSLVLWPNVFLTALHLWAVLVRASIFQKKLVRCRNVFF